MRGAMFLDRDGVINRVVTRNGVAASPRSPEEFEVLPDVPQALRELKAGGYALVVVTNQPDVARGLLAPEAVEVMHQELKAQLPLDAILSCFHDDADGCDCRKPKPGMLLRAARDLGIDLASSFMVGDRWRDVEAGRRAGCRTFFLDRNCGEQGPTGCDFVVHSLSEVAGIVMALGQS
jgi:D-glycero-D-manno-heptose 1,7-bisphosphate phosphatase